MLSKTGTRDTWSERNGSNTVTYNRTPHGTTGFAPAVINYSFLCSNLDEVPEAYSDLLRKELHKYKDWTSMKLYIQKTTLVRSTMISRFTLYSSIHCTY
jgi:hypothetical protein